MTWSELYFKKISPAVLRGMIVKTERRGAEKLLRQQNHLRQEIVRDWARMVKMGRRELMAGRYCSGRKLTGFDNSKYKIFHNSVYHSCLVLLEVAKICRPSVIDAKKSDFIPT